MVDLLPEIEVVADDAFNSSPSDPKMMGPEALERFNRGEELPVSRVKTPLVGITPSSAPINVAMLLQRWTCSIVEMHSSQCLLLKECASPLGSHLGRFGWKVLTGDQKADKAGVDGAWCDCRWSCRWVPLKIGSVAPSTLRRRCRKE